MPRRELTVAVLCCLVAGSLLTFAYDGRAAGAWGRVAFAGVVAVAASRGWGRRVVGGALVVVGALVLGDFPFASLPLYAAGALVAVRGPRWPALGARYDAPSARPATDADLWTAMDRGEDPTE